MKCKIDDCFNETARTYCSRSCSNKGQPKRVRKCTDGVSLCSDITHFCYKRNLCQQCKSRNTKKITKICRWCEHENAQKIRIQLWCEGKLNAIGITGRKKDGLAWWARKYLQDLQKMHVKIVVGI